MTYVSIYVVLILSTCMPCDMHMHEVADHDLFFFPSLSISLRCLSVLSTPWFPTVFLSDSGIDSLSCDSSH